MKTSMDEAWRYAGVAWDKFISGDYLNAERNYLMAAQYASEAGSDRQAAKRTVEWDKAATRCRKLREDKQR